jgi:pimeloyl-ACP methyl ester carboxylesterase
MWRTVPRRIALIVAVCVAAFAVWFAPAPGGTVTASQLGKLSILSSLSSSAATKYLQEHPSMALEVLNSEPVEVADWWNGTPRDDQRDLIKYAPELIGNLDGVDYASRDKANRIHLAAALGTAKRNIAKNPSNDTAKGVFRALTAINGTISAKTKPARYLVSLTNGKPPLAAVAVGNLDTARQVTYNVPGMGTYTDDMQLWTQSAQNVYQAQGTVGANSDRAVVAWIGYETPPPGIDATQGDYAARGAPFLVDDIKGLHAVRRGTPKYTVSIIAHSYGTTMAANALASRRLGVFSFVMLGSAGIERSIPNATALHAEHVYAGEAVDDQEARWGRITRQDPRSAAFGATVIDVDGDANEGYLPVTGHAPVLHSKWNDNLFSSAWSGVKNINKLANQYLEHFETFGYLDDGTESLQNAAIATTPDATMPLLTGH